MPANRKKAGGISHLVFSTRGNDAVRLSELYFSYLDEGKRLVKQAPPLANEDVLKNKGIAPFTVLDVPFTMLDSALFLKEFVVLLLIQGRGNRGRLSDRYYQSSFLQLVPPIQS